jgi:hypothetical protein
LLQLVNIEESVCLLCLNCSITCQYLLFSGLISSLVAIFGGLYSTRNSNSRMSNHFLKLRWGSSSIVFGFVVYKIWDQIDWNPPAVQKLQRYIAYAFKKDLGLLTEKEAAAVEQASAEKLK